MTIARMTELGQSITYNIWGNYSLYINVNFKKSYELKVAASYGCWLKDIYFGIFIYWARYIIAFLKNSIVFASGWQFKISTWNWSYIKMKLKLHVSPKKEDQSHFTCRAKQMNRCTKYSKSTRHVAFSALEKKAGLNGGKRCVVACRRLSKSL